MKDDANPIEQACQEILPTLQAIQADLEEFFPLVHIHFKEKLEALENTPTTELQNKNEQILKLLNKIHAATKEISQIKTFMNYREFGDIIINTISLLESLQSLLTSNITDFYRECHRLLKYYWAIRYVIARFELESIPLYFQNQIMFFNLPDALFDFLETLKEGPQPVEVLRDVDLEVRIHKGLPIMITRSPDEISLSVLGERFFNVHSISELYCFYLYEFEEDILDLKQ